MNRRRTTAAVVLAAFAALTSAASAHKGNPSYESLITARTGLQAGLTVPHGVDPRVPGRPGTISGDLNWASNDEKESS
jgi:hypothetical protein